MKVKKLHELLVKGEISKKDISKKEWKKISALPLTEHFIREFNNKLDWDILSLRQELTDAIIEDFKDKLNWIILSCKRTLSEDIIRKYHYKVDWESVSLRREFSEEFLHEFRDDIDWAYISPKQKYSIDFIREHKDFIDWDNFSSYNKIVSSSDSEEFIREFAEYINWGVFNRIAPPTHLSEEFIIEFQDRLPRKYIEDRIFYENNPDKLSPEFIEKFNKSCE